MPSDRASAAATPSPPNASEKRLFRAATFNALDFFTPQPRHADRFGEKLAWTADLLARLDADAIALQEIGDADVLDRLVAALNARIANPGAPYVSIVGTADQRGIRCAILARVPVVEARVHTTDQLPFPVFQEGDVFPFPARLPLRRGIVHAKVATAVGLVHLLAVHFKSGRPVALKGPGGEAIAWRTVRARGEADLRALVMRSAEALFVRGLVDELLEADARAQVVVLGDFNDGVDSTPVGLVRGVGSRHGLLHACAQIVPEPQRFSLIYRGQKLLLDHVLASEGLRGKLARVDIANEALRDHGSKGDDDAPIVDSDHAPVVAEFVG